MPLVVPAHAIEQQPKYITALLCSYETHNQYVIQSPSHSQSV